MKYQLAIDNRVAVPVKGKLVGADRGTHVNFDFTLDMARIDQDELTKAQASNADFFDFLLSKTSGWDGQRLVKDENGAFAPFNADSFHALLSVPGMRLHVYRAYLEALAPQEKNS